MNTTQEPAFLVSPADTHRLERSNARWRLAATALGAGLAGLLIGGVSRQPAAHDYRYVATDDTIYRIDAAGAIEYLRVENGVRSAQGYFGWGEVRVDPERRNSTRPQP